MLPNRSATGDTAKRKVVWAVVSLDVATDSPGRLKKILMTIFWFQLVLLKS